MKGCKYVVRIPFDTQILKISHCPDDVSIYYKNCFMKNTKQRLFEVIEKIDDTYKSSNTLNETKAFGELRKLNKELYDDTINLEVKIGDDVLKLIDDAIEKLKYDTDEEYELAYQIILDSILSRFLNRRK